MISYNTRIEKTDDNGKKRTVSNPILIADIDKQLIELTKMERGFTMVEEFLDKELQLLIVKDLHCLRISRIYLKDNPNILTYIKDLNYFDQSPNQVYVLGNTTYKNNIKYLESSYFGMSDKDNLNRLKQHVNNDKEIFDDMIVFEIRNPFVKNSHIESIIISWMMEKNMLSDNQNRGKIESVTKEEMITASNIIYLMLYKFNVIGKDIELLNPSFVGNTNSSADRAKSYLFKLFPIFLKK